MNDHNPHHPQPAVASAIDYPCPHCASPLRVGGQLAGKSVQCPQCGQLSLVPFQQPRPHPTMAPSSSETDISSGELASIQELEVVPEVVDGIPKERNTRENVPSAAMSSSRPGVGVSSSPSPASFSSATETAESRLYQRIRNEVKKIFVGQDDLVLGSLVALFSGGHVLIESVPGLGKTLFVRTLGKVLGCAFGRIQFTADLMPSDITGAPIFNMKTQEFEFRPGPVFTQLLLADEINRSPAKTHAALLEIMQEKHVTIDGKTHELELPFLVMATQNPIESEGTYNLPEAQLDRFMFKLRVDYPSAQQEAEILMMHGGQSEVTDRLDELEQVTTPQEILQVTQNTSQVRVDPLLVDYINKIVRSTRQWPPFYMGASPRAGIGLMQGARTLAAFAGRDFTVPDDVVGIALPALRHRVVLTAEAEVEGQSVDQLLTEMIRTIEVPRLR
jgi:MoxR-like ATPase